MHVTFCLFYVCSVSFQDAFFGRDLLLSCKKLGKSGDAHEAGHDSMKLTSEEGVKGNTESSDIKVPLKEVIISSSVIT